MGSSMSEVGHLIFALISLLPSKTIYLFLIDSPMSLKSCSTSGNTQTNSPLLRSTLVNESNIKKVSSHKDINEEFNKSEPQKTTTSKKPKNKTNDDGKKINSNSETSDSVSIEDQSSISDKNNLNRPENDENNSKKLEDKRDHNSTKIQLVKEAEIYFNYYIQPSFTLHQEDFLKKLLNESNSGSDTRPFILGSSTPIWNQKINYFDLIIDVLLLLLFRLTKRILF